MCALLLVRRRLAGRRDCSAMSAHPRGSIKRMQLPPCTGPVGRIYLYSIMKLALSLLVCLVAVSLCYAEEPEAAAPVKVALYYESLCPDCQEFITGTLVHVWNTKELRDIMNLTLVPYGNAQEPSPLHFDCQHGPEECKGNELEACGIKMYPDVEQHFKFVHCLENFGDSMLQHIAHCAGVADMDANNVTDCMNGQEGKKYEHDMAEMTPDHSFVPWVTVDGKELQDDFDNLKYYICNAYTGEKPSVCNGALRMPSRHQALKLNSRK